MSSERVLPAAPPELHPLVSVEWHGELRLRAERLVGVRLTKSEAQAAPRLELRHSGTGPAFATADLRLRLRPVLRVGEWSEIHSQIDLPGGMVLGTDPAASSLAERYTGETGQRPIGGGIQVKRLWLQARVFEYGQVELGRAPDHFGLGILRNQGGDLLGDFQSDVDRVAVRADLFGFRWLLARDSLASWPPETAGSGTVTHSLEDAADVTRWLLEIQSGRVRHDRGLRWGAAVGYTTQDVGLFLEHYADPSDCVEDGKCRALVPRDARFITPQVHVDWRGGGAGRPLRLQAELALIYGTLGNTDVLDKTLTPKTIVSAGGAMRASLRTGRHEWQLELGGATGESDGGFGVLDTDNFKREDGRNRSLLTGFRFHRNYRVDGILFRDVIGAVANTLYLRPDWQLHLYEGGERERLSLGVGCLIAAAASADATPGGGSLLGVEPSFSLEYRAGRAIARLGGSGLLPGAAFALPGPTGREAEPAWRVESVLQLGF